MLFGMHVIVAGGAEAATASGEQQAEATRHHWILLLENCDI